MTTLDLDTLAALLDKATPGPFYWFMRECADKHALMVELTAVVEKTNAVNGYNLHGVGVGEPEPDADYLAVAHTGCGPRSPVNAALIAAAVNALPELIARIRELEQQVQACGIRPRGKSVAPEALAAVIAMRERCAQACEQPPWKTRTECAAAIRALEP